MAAIISIVVEDKESKSGQREGGEAEVVGWSRCSHCSIEDGE
jgi:hypothetical protein